MLTCNKHDILADVKSFFKSTLTAGLYLVLNFGVLSLYLCCLEPCEFWAPRKAWNSVLTYLYYTMLVLSQPLKKKENKNP